MLPGDTPGPSKWKPGAPKMITWAAKLILRSSKRRPKSVKMASPTVECVPSWALTTQLAALDAPENDFWCPWEPLGLILEDPRLLLWRIWRPQDNKFPRLWPPIGLGGNREAKTISPG